MKIVIIKICVYNCINSYLFPLFDANCRSVYICVRLFIDFSISYYILNFGQRHNIHIYVCARARVCVREWVSTSWCAYGACVGVHVSLFVGVSGLPQAQ